MPMTAPESNLERIRGQIGQHLDDLETLGGDPAARTYSLHCLRRLVGQLDGLGARDLLAYRSMGGAS